MKPTYLFGLIGKSLGHSFSRGYFTEKFQQLGISAAYQNFELQHIQELKSVLQSHPNLVGLNVTIPYKEALYHFLADGATFQEPVMAANTLVIQQGKIIGVHNTDVHGFRESLRRFYPHPNGKALILGTGGASKAVYAALNPPVFFQQVDFASRNPQTELELSYAQINQQGLSGYDLIVNTTPLGMFPDVDTLPDLPYDSLKSHQYLFDLVYNPTETQFLKQGRVQGCATQNGLEMLHLQAEKAWDIWKTHLKTPI